jgi:hypothetical protein
MSAFQPKQKQPPQRTSSTTAGPRTPARSINQQEHPSLNLQRTIGNQAVLRLMRSGSQGPELGSAVSRQGFSGLGFGRIPASSAPAKTIQPKLTVNTPGDSFEQEADRVADQVMRMPNPSAPPSSAMSGGVAGVQRACACGGTCSDCKNAQPDHPHAQVQMKSAASGNAGGMEAPPIVHEVLRSPGRPLDAATRAFMEPRFGQDFSSVRVHTDAKAAESASAVQARAYTAGRNVVFGAGEYGPGTDEGQRLLGHELTHVVQQRGSPVAAPRVQRKATQKDEDDKKLALKDHEAQQKNVAAHLDDARKLQTTAYSSATDANVLFHNSVELLDSGKITLFVLTPTHYSTQDKPAYFDQTFKYTQAKPAGGDYPADPAASATSIDHPSPGESGGVPKAPQMPTYTPISPTSPKGTSPPPTTPPPVQWTSAFMKLYLPRTPVTRDGLRDTFVHEAQHVADWSHLKPATLSDWKSILEEYKSEFRAYWVQPGFSMVDPDPLRTAENPVDLAASRTCHACPAPAATSTGMPPPLREQPTNLKNKKQAQIFWKLINEYQHEEFDCFYVCNKDFRDAVDNFAFPTAENLVNSVRLLNLHIELQKLNPGISRADLLKTGFPQAMKDLDRIDWEFLSNEKLSAPFWDLFTTSAPPVLLKGFQKLAKKGAPSANDIDNVIALVK